MVHFVVGMLLVDGVGGTVKGVAEKRRRRVVEEEKAKVVEGERPKEGSGGDKGGKWEGEAEAVSEGLHAGRR